MSVSDMLLTQTSDGQPIPEPAAKTVVYAQRFLFSYTGAASLAGRRTDEWLAERLVPRDALLSKLERVRAEASDALRGSDPRNRHLVIAGIGWPADEQGRTTKPGMVTLTNSLDGFSVPAVATFSLSMRIAREQYILADYGQPIPPAIRKRLHRDVRRRLSVNSSPQTVASLLIGAAKHVAFHNPRCGAELLFSYIPKPLTSQLPEAFMQIGGPFDWSEPVYHYIPAAPDGPLVARMPTFVQAGAIIAGGMVGREDTFDAAPQSWRPRTGH